MHQPRHAPKLRITTILLVVVIIAFVCYTLHSEYYDAIDREDFGTRCISELTNMKYQLDSVLKYKKLMDGVLNEVQEECLTQKQVIMRYSTNYVLMKRHLEICEVQTEAVEEECKELKASLLKVNAELAACKKAPG